jgi:hypothetical protein
VDGGQGRARVGASRGGSAAAPSVLLHVCVFPPSLFCLSFCLSVSLLCSEQRPSYLKYFQFKQMYFHMSVIPASSKSRGLCANESVFLFFLSFLLSFFSFSLSFFLSFFVSFSSPVHKVVGRGRAHNDGNLLRRRRRRGGHRVLLFFGRRRIQHLEATVVFLPGQIRHKGRLRPVRRTQQPQAKTRVTSSRRMLSQGNPAKKGCALISLMPPLAPRRRSGSVSSARMIASPSRLISGPCKTTISQTQTGDTS